LGNRFNKGVQTSVEKAGGISRSTGSRSRGPSTTLTFLGGKNGTDEDGDNKRIRPFRGGHVYLTGQKDNGPKLGRRKNIWEAGERPKNTLI